MNPEPIWDWLSSVQFLGRYRVEGESSKFRNSVGYITAMNALQYNCYGNGRNYGEAQMDFRTPADTDSAYAAALIRAALHRESLPHF